MENSSKSKPKTPRNKLITVIQAVLMFFMSLAATASLLPDVGPKYYILAIVFGWLAVTGAVSLVFPKVSPFFFSISVFAASLWAILSTSVFDFGNTLGNDVITSFRFERIMPSFESLGTWPEFLILAGLGLFTITGYLVLSSLHSLQTDYRNMYANDVDEQEIKFSISNNLVYLILSLLSGLGVVAVLAVLLKFIQLSFLDEMAEYPWAVLLLGIPAILIIAGLIYIITSKRKIEKQP